MLPDDGSAEGHGRTVSTLEDLGEFGLIRRMAPGSVIAPARVVQGIGDDCAVTRGPEGMLALVTTDMLVQGVHFTNETITPRQLGAKAMAVNLSDIAAMGGIPLDAYVSLAIPATTALSFLDELYEGMKAMARRFGVNILGGDTTGSRMGLVVSITVTGQVEEPLALYRHGARPGDTLFLTGSVGDAAAGLHALMSGMSREHPDAQALIRRHQEPTPHLAQGRVMAQSGHAHAMIDVSDGLLGDLSHVCDLSRTGCAVRQEALPLSDELRRYAARHSLDAFRLALNGGEDYVLLVAGEPDLADVASRQGVALCPIGIVTDAPRRCIRPADGVSAPFEGGGFDHFSGRGLATAEEAQALRAKSATCPSDSLTALPASRTSVRGA